VIAWAPQRTPALRALTDCGTLMALLLALFGHQGQLDGG